MNTNEQYERSVHSEPYRPQERLPFLKQLSPVNKVKAIGECLMSHEAYTNVPILVRAGGIAGVLERGMYGEMSTGTWEAHSVLE